VQADHVLQYNVSTSHAAALCASMHSYGAPPCMLLLLMVVLMLPQLT
jgi:hypothetical protein